MKISIIPTTSAEHLAKSILAKTKVFEIVFPNLNKDGKRYFPDGEVYVGLSSKFLSKFGQGHKKRVIVLHSGMPKPNEGLMELELILQILKNTKVKPVEVFFTYFPYGMQDKVFEKGETNIAENLIEKFINYYQIKKIYIIDAHFCGKKWLRKYPVVNISAVPILIEEAKKDFGRDILFLSTDIGGKRRTKIPGIKKERENSFRIKIVSDPINLKGRIVGFVDDILETGGTLLRAYNQSKKWGAKKIIALITHGVLPSGISKIKKKYAKLYLTNTIKQKEANIDLTDLILENILMSS